MWMKIVVCVIVVSLRVVSSFVVVGKQGWQYDTRLLGEKDDMVKKLREQAEQLRKEVSQFEEGKREVERVEEEERQQIQAVKKEERLRYSADVPILKGDGNVVVERVDFPPVLPKNKSSILTVEASLPLGIILGEHEEIPGAVQVDEVVENSNGDLAGVRVGDILRATTACQVTMTQPTWQLIAGGIGQPQTTRMMFSTDRKPFEEVMEAIGSNRMDPTQRPLCLVFERPEL